VAALFLSCSAVTVAFSTFLGFSRSVDAEALLLDFVRFFAFVGFAEELFFRGYVQERFNAQRMLFQSLDVSLTVKRIENKYSSSGR